MATGNGQKLAVKKKINIITIVQHDFVYPFFRPEGNRKCKIEPRENS